jgi:hypothetical protein
MKRSLFTSVRALILLLIGLALTINASGQKVDFYIQEMSQALLPYGTLTAPTCHAVEIDLKGPWANYALPDGVGKENGELTWSILKLDVIRLDVNLSDLDEDKVMNHPIFSLEYINKHRKGTPYIADTPAVMLFTLGPNNNMTVHTVDLDKMEALGGHTHTSESHMGVSHNERKFAIITFSDQEHAGAFQKAILKAIVLCKAQ